MYFTGCQVKGKRGSQFFRHALIQRGQFGDMPGQCSGQGLRQPPVPVRTLCAGGVDDAIGHYWGKLNTWSKVATVGLAGLGGYYAYIQARSIYLSLKGFVTELKDAVNQYKADKQAAQEADQQNCLPTLVALC